MFNYSQETYGERIAGLYDQWYPVFDPATIQVLSELAHGGSALELGIGTGRIALPLLKSGVSVCGIDASQSMVDRLREKPGGDKIPVTIGNFADVSIEGQFQLIYVVFNTFYSLLTQEEQVHCFQNVAGHLAPDGVFLVEAFVPDLSRYTRDQNVSVNRLGENEVYLDVSQIETEKQVITTHHVVLTDQGTSFYPVKIRYAWPSEMDLMARISLLQLRERWGDWNKAKFSATSSKHISIYEHSK